MATARPCVPGHEVEDRGRTVEGDHLQRPAGTAKQAPQGRPDDIDQGPYLGLLRARPEWGAGRPALGRRVLGGVLLGGVLLGGVLRNGPKLAGQPHEVARCLLGLSPRSPRARGSA